MHLQNDREQTLKAEQAFFDKEATELSEQEILIPTPADIERFKHATPSPANFTKDEFFARLLPLEGKEVLDYGCGHGENSSLLAACGARVTAFDLSPKSVEQAGHRAKLHGLSDRIQFDVRAAGQLDYPPGRFDVVAGFNVLHHLHTMLPAVFAEIRRVLKPGGTAGFIEPVVNSKTLALLRRIAPVPCYATPDERQLTYADFAPLREHFQSVEMYHFHGLTRLGRITGNKGLRSMARLDYYAQKALPFLRRFYGMVVVIAR